MRVGVTQGGTSQAGNPWRRQDFVVEWYEHPTDQFTSKVVLSLMNNDIDAYHLKEGDKVRARIWLNVREYQGKSYQEARLAKDGLQVIQRLGQPPVASAQGAPAYQSQYAPQQQQQYAPQQQPQQQQYAPQQQPPQQQQYMQQGQQTAPPYPPQQQQAQGNDGLPF